MIYSSTNKDRNRIAVYCAAMTNDKADFHGEFPKCLGHDKEVQFNLAYNYHDDL